MRCEGAAPDQSCLSTDARALAQHNAGLSLPNVTARCGTSAPPMMYRAVNLDVSTSPSHAAELLAWSKCTDVTRDTQKEVPADRVALHYWDRSVVVGRTANTPHDWFPGPAVGCWHPCALLCALLERKYLIGNTHQSAPDTLQPVSDTQLSVPDTQAE